MRGHLALTGYRVLPWVVAVTLALPCVAHDVIDDGISKESRKSVLGLRLIGAVLETFLEHHVNIAPTKTFQPIQDFANTLDEFYSSHIPLVDGWGRDYLFFTVDGDVVVLSRGPDGEIDDAKGIIKIANKGFGQIPSLKRLKGDDLILFNDSLIDRPRPQRLYQMQAMADVRAIGTALESYAIDHGTLPASTAGLVSVRFLEKSLKPIYIREIEATDSWGNAFQYWSNGQEYILICLGSDGLSDHDYEGNLAALPTLNYQANARGIDKDIVLLNGTFVQWPYGRTQ